MYYYCIHLYISTTANIILSSETSHVFKCEEWVATLHIAVVALTLTVNSVALPHSIYQELMKAAVELFDLVGLFIIISQQVGRGDLKILVAGTFDIFKSSFPALL